MKLIVGMDIKNGKCVQLVQGKIETSKINSSNPVELCKLWDNGEIQKIHIVDLDGVFSGQTQMFSLLSDIRKATKLPIQFGGGVRNYETAKKILDSGIEQIVLGPSAIKNQDLLVKLLTDFPNRIIVSVDIYKGFVYTEGWEESSCVLLLDFINTLKLLGTKTIMVTDISRDGILSDANLELLDKLLQETSLSIILSGGINSDSDIEKLRTKHVEGVVIETAVYEGLKTI